MSGLMESVPSYVIQFVLSKREYEVLVERLDGRFTRMTLPDPKHVAAGKDVTPIIRNHIRLYIKVYAILRLVGGAADLAMKARRVEGPQLPASRMALSVTAMAALYRISYKILSLLAAKDESSSAQYKRKVLVPLVSGLISGSAYGIMPKHAARGYIGLWAATKAVEYIYNYLDDEGYLAFKPRLLGSWALFPFAFSQLFHTFIFDPDCCPSGFTRIMMRLSDSYMPAKPQGVKTPWVEPEDVLAGIAAISQLKYPRFVSSLLFPGKATLPPELSSIAPVVNRAHPATKTLTAALTHPYEPSEFKTFAGHAAKKFQSVSKYLFAFYLLIGLLRRRATGDKLPSVLSGSIANTLRSTVFVVMSASSAWYGIGLSQKVLGASVLPLYRFRVIGFLSGLWAFVDQVNSRGRYLYATRLAAMSYWNVLVKKHKVRPVKNGEVILFAAALGVIMVLVDRAPGSVSGKGLRKSLNWMKSGEFVDPSSRER
ncbi:hypothetical protein TRVA0_025S01376 [Trichomonascus vanleenenianus]|uniref:uncharacterized protein n=1 Tax=Trichomonascus vanleenenianus TaxID=2268995 RepID=UPI003EC9589A